MIAQARDVLIIEDNASALNNFGIFLEQHLNIKPFLASTPAHALSIIKDYPLKVIITDQELESEMTGVDIAEKVKAMGHDAQLIMLTGQADKEAITRALNIGYSRVVKKENIDELISAVQEALISHKVALPSAHTDTIIHTKMKLFARSEIRLIRVNVVDPRLINDDEWQMTHEASPNIKTTKVVSAKHTVSSKYEASTEIRLVLKNKLSLSNLLPALGSKIENQYQSQTFQRETAEEEYVISSEQSIEIKEIDEKPDETGKILRSRKYETAPTYIRIGGVLRTDCSCCTAPKDDYFYADFPRNELATRQVDYYHDGTSEIVPTGFIKAVKSNA